MKKLAIFSLITTTFLVSFYFLNLTKFTQLSFEGDNLSMVVYAEEGDASSPAGGLVPECPAGGCGFEELMQMINKVINFLLFTIATPLAALIFAYAGFLLITASGDPGKLSTAKSILKNVIFGYLFALAAWLIINTILTSLGFDGPWFLTR